MQMDRVYGALCIGATGVIIWGCWWVAKTFSYVLFYEGMVKSSVMEVLKAQGLL